jgi:long-chain acyl-CoA synthetase
MKTAAGPVLAPVAPEDHVLRPLLDRLQREPEAKIASYREGDRFVDISVRDFVDRVRCVARGLIASGVGPGDRVALMSHTRLEWLILDFGILAAGGVTVPIYDTSSTEQIRWILGNSEAVLLVVETPAMAATAATLRPEVPSCLDVIVIDDGALEELARRAAATADAEVDARIDALRADDLATIIYTSGTTGMPKGCMLTHANLCANTAQTIDALGREVRPGDTGLLFLPLAHALTKGNALFAVATGIRLGFATDMGHLPTELKMYKPSTIAAVPRIFEKVYNTASHTAHREGKGAIFERSASTAIRWSRASSTGRVMPWLRLEHAVFDQLVYRKIHAAFGERLRLAFSGGGPLGERLTHFFAGVGVQIYEGYGLTETSPTLTLNRPGAWKPGTVGRPLAGTTLAIAADGEILVRGPQVFAGYWRNERATAESFDADGWFLTGDIGELDDDGFVRITGRKKELIVTAAGKNVAPAPLEDRLRAHELVSQAVVVGDGKPFIAALVTIDASAFADWAKEHGRPGVPFEELRTDAAFQAEIQAAVDHANASVSRAESIRSFAILPHDLSIEAGELTPTLKLRRAVVAQRYAEEIDRLYAGRPPGEEEAAMSGERR